MQNLIAVDTRMQSFIDAIVLLSTSITDRELQKQILKHYCDSWSLRLRVFAIALVIFAQMLI